MEEDKTTTKKLIIFYIIAGVLSTAAVLSVILLLLSKDSDLYRTQKVAEAYYSDLQNCEKEKMQKLFLSDDIAEISDACENFDTYFDNAYNSCVSSYGEGFTISLDEFSYTDLDSEAKSEFKEVYGDDITNAGLLHFQITFSCAPSAALDGGTQVSSTDVFYDNLVMLKKDNVWYPAVSLGLKNGISQRYFTAMRFGEKEISIAEYNFFYNMLSDMTEDDSSSEQTVSDSDVINYITEMYALCKKAETDGFTPDSKDVEDMENELNDIKQIADSFGSASQKYYSAYYGMGMTEELLHSVYYSQLVMQSYISHLGEILELSDDDIEKYYSENRDTFDLADILYYEFYSSAEGSLDAAEAKAKALLDASSSPEEFSQNCKNAYSSLTQEQKNFGYYGKEAYVGSGFKYTDFQDVATDFRDWAFSDSRISGDKNYFSVDSGDEDFGYIVVAVYIVEPRHRENYKTVDFMYATVLTKELSEDEAEAQINSEYEKWLAGEQTVQNFGKLADEFYNSEDENKDGGSYVLISKGDMLDSIDSWVFDENRQPGDCDVIKSDIGYHIIYFIDRDIEKWELDVKSNVSEDKVEGIYSEAMSSGNLKVLSLNIVMYC